MNEGLDPAGRRIKIPGEPRLYRYVGMKITPVYKLFAEWMEEETGYKPDIRTLQMGGQLRDLFQKSTVNQLRLKRIREKRIDRIAKEFGVDPAAIKKLKKTYSGD